MRGPSSSSWTMLLRLLLVLIPLLVVDGFAPLRRFQHSRPPELSLSSRRRTGVVVMLERLPLYDEFSQLRALLLAPPGSSAVDEASLERADRLAKDVVLSLAKTAKTVPFDRGANPFLPRAFVAALLFLDDVTKAAANATTTSSYASPSLSTVLRHVPRKNGLGALCAKVSADYAKDREGTRTLRRPRFETSLLRYRCMESISRAVSEAAIVTLLWRSLESLPPPPPPPPSSSFLLSSVFSSTKYVLHLYHCRLQTRHQNIRKKSSRPSCSEYRYRYLSHYRYRCCRHQNNSYYCLAYGRFRHLRQVGSAMRTPV